MTLTPEQMDQIRELIRYDAAVHSSLSSSVGLIIASLGGLGGWLITRWRSRRMQSQRQACCPLCSKPTEAAGIESEIAK